MRREREAVARELLEAFADVEELELPPTDENRIHSWHLFPIRLRLDRLAIDRNAFMDELKARGVGCSVHWRPLHLHPYYEETFGWRPDDLPAATRVWETPGQPADLPGHAGGRDRARHRDGPGPVPGTPDGRPRGAGAVLTQPAVPSGSKGRGCRARSRRRSRSPAWSRRRR